MTKEEAAAYLRVKPATLESWRATGSVRLPFVRVGGQVMYKRADVERFIVEGTTVPKVRGA